MHFQNGNVIVSDMDELRKKEKKIFFKKIEPYLSKKIQIMIDFENWTATEVSKAFGIPSNRQSEMKKPKRYPNGGLNEPLLETSLQGGLCTVTQIKTHVDLTDKEKVFLDTFAVHEEAALLKKAGYDPAKILRDFRHEHNIKDTE